MTTPENQQDQAAEQQNQSGAAAGAPTELQEEVVSDALINAIDDDEIEVKSTGAFVVRFLKEVGRTKLLKGSKAALEQLLNLSFGRDVTSAGGEVDEDAPKKRGRKPNAAKMTEGDAKAIVFTFWDDAENAAATFVESLASKAGFGLEVASLNDMSEETEVFTFSDVKVVPSYNHIEFSNEKDSDSARVLRVKMTYSELARTNKAEEQE